MNATLFILVGLMFVAIAQYLITNGGSNARV
jgi:hypothetical protein